MKLSLIEKKAEVAGVESFIFQPQEPLKWKAGQFLHYVLHHEPTDDRGSDRWFTVASAPFEGTVMITTRITDDKGSSFKKALTALNVGESIEISDIDGDFTVEDPQAEFVFIAGGIGVTPFHSILKEADHQGVQLKATLLYANRDENIVYKDELESFKSRNPHLAICYCTGQRLDEEAIRKFVSDLTKPIFYVSGPEPMVESLGKMLEGMGIGKERIRQDFFPGYPAE
jgi:ferredoxin-NADP reductase